MKQLTQLAHEAVAKVLKAGDIAIDLTAGNGWDTLFLARCVGPSGHVFSFDIQADAIEATHRLLSQHAAQSMVTLHSASHADWSSRVPLENRMKIKAAMMNLGYLPKGDKSIVTQVSSTLAAIQSVVEWLQPQGLITILVYTGHPGGQSEADAVQAMLLELDSATFELSREPAIPVSQSPRLHLVLRK